MKKILPLVIVALAFVISSDVKAGLLYQPTRYYINSGLVGYWTFDGTYINGTRAFDSSGNGAQGTLTGGPVPRTGKFLQALTFDGIDDYVDIGTGPGTVNAISFWVYPNTTTEYFINLTGTTDFIWANAGTVTATGLSGTIYVNGVVSSSIVANKWHHIVVVTSTSENASNLDIGRTEDANYLEGYMDDVRLYNRTLSSEEIRRLYAAGNSGFNVSQTSKITSGLMGYYTFDGADTVHGNLNDLSGNENDLLLAPGSNIAFFGRIPGKIGQALSFNGVNDSATRDVADRTGPFTVSVWVKSANPGQAEYSTIFASSDAGTSDSFQIDVGGAEGCAGQYRFYINTAGFGEIDVPCFGTMTTQWQFLTATFDGSTARTYLNGVFANQAASSALGSFLVHKVGVNRGGTVFFKGSIDEFRIYNRVLTNDEIRRLYNMGSSVVNASQTSKLTSGLVGYWTFDGPDTTIRRKITAMDRSGSGNMGFAIAATTSPFAPGKLGQAFNLDGSDDYMALNGTSFDGTGDITLTAWVLSTGGHDNPHIIGSASGLQWSVDRANNRICITSNNVAVNCSTLGSFSLAKWHFVAIVRPGSGSNVIIYVDNVPVSTVSSGTPVAQTVYQVGNLNGIRPFGGFIDEFRIYNKLLTSQDLTRLYNMGS